jgi:hypothetical protein
VVLLLALIGGGVVLFLASDDDSPGGGSGSGRSPEEVTRAFIDAARFQDCEALLDLVSESWLATSGASRDEQLASCKQTELVPYEFAVTATEIVSRNGASVVVSVTADVPGGSGTEEFTVVNEGGEWKVDPSSISAGNGTGTVDQDPATGSPEPAPPGLPDEPGGP